MLQDITFVDTENADIRVYYKRLGVKDAVKTKKIYYCNANKSPVNIPMLRHTLATRCIENGVSPVALQRILGHKDIQVTLNTDASGFNYIGYNLKSVEVHLKGFNKSK